MDGREVKFTIPGWLIWLFNRATESSTWRGLVWFIFGCWMLATKPELNINDVQYVLQWLAGADEQFGWAAIAAGGLGVLTKDKT